MAAPFSALPRMWYGGMQEEEWAKRTKGNVRRRWRHETQDSRAELWDVIYLGEHRNSTEKVLLSRATTTPSKWLKGECLSFYFWLFLTLLIEMRML